MNKDKIKKSLEHCRDGKCSECPYNGWVKEMCRKVLIIDTLLLIKELDKPQKSNIEQITFDI